jgi:transposase-like protein
MNPSNHLPQSGRGRRTYSADFKSQVVAACRMPGVSIASVARTHGINHNVVHRWLRGLPDPGVGPRRAADAELVPPGFIELPMPPTPVAPRQAQDGRVQVDLKRGDLSVKISWPASAPACAQWLVDLLR